MFALFAKVAGECIPLMGRICQSDVKLLRQLRGLRPWRCISCKGHSNLTFWGDLLGELLSKTKGRPSSTVPGSSELFHVRLISLWSVCDLLRKILVLLDSGKAGSAPPGRPSSPREPRCRPVGGSPPPEFPGELPSDQPTDQQFGRSSQRGCVNLDTVAGSVLPAA